GSWSLGDENKAIWSNYKQWMTTHDKSVTPSPPAKATTSYPILKIGSKGENVKKLQAALKKHRFYFGTVTGLYDTKTKNA
ncbi:peptidoglycan-binding domain-containing protein, partial [Pseudomonas sp. FW305-BF6]|uniref:peptidoglycan-binding domain-containing protein n=1 Tax=Pseudomonas sp. FW305-BF6 TaxID=2070673 RepID=UPI001C48ACB0